MSRTTQNDLMLVIAIDGPSAVSAPAEAGGLDTPSGPASFSSFGLPRRTPCAGSFGHAVGFRMTTKVAASSSLQPMGLGRRGVRRVSRLHYSNNKAELGASAETKSQGCSIAWLVTDRAVSSAPAALTYRLAT
jgi:hypothetical protein